VSTRVSLDRPAPSYEGLPNCGVALSALAATAGVIHLVAAIEHVAVSWMLGVFFALVGTGQLIAGWWIQRNPQDERMLKPAALASVAVALLWVFSRTTGLPFGPDAGKVSSVGVADTLVTLQELAFAAIVGVIVWRGERRLAWLSGPLGVRLTFAVLSLTLLMAALGGHKH
jgi:hypothetical protein